MSCMDYRVRCAMRVFIYKSQVFPENQLESLNKWLVSQNEPIVSDPIFQEVPEDVFYEDFVNDYFSQTKYDERKQKLFNAYYKRKVRELIRQKYDENDEFAILRQRDSKPNEFVLYNTYVENCKSQVKKELGMEQ